MRACLVSHNAYRHDVRARTLARSLVAAGHEVVVVASGNHEETEVDGIPVRFVPTRAPRGLGLLGRLLRRLQPAPLRSRLHEIRLARTAGEMHADCYYPTASVSVRTAAKAAGNRATVVRDPRWPDAGPRDLVSLAPHHPELSRSPAGPGLGHHTSLHSPGTPVPEPDRHDHLRVALCYRKTDSNPGRYLEAAMRRAGITVDLHTDVVDVGSLPEDTDAIVFVEGPYPALTVTGAKPPGVPTLFWVHHGEHHLMTNLRLCERYGADAVLLAHSWHLAHRFPVPVHRFPFGTAPEILDAGTPLAARRFDAAMVGGQLRRRGGTYERRQQLVAIVEEALGPERVAFESDIDAEAMADLYGRARMVLNEGGTRHYPITMRVFEAIGSGCVLLTDDLPGTDVLFRTREHYVVLEDDVASQVRRMLAAPDRLQAIASAAVAHAAEWHTYDHRVDELVAILDATTPSQHRPLPERGTLASIVDRDVEVQRIAVFDAEELAARLPEREVWDGTQILERLEPATMEAVVVGKAGSPHLERAVASARRYIYAVEDHDAVRSLAAARKPAATFSNHDGVLRVDLKAESYRANVSTWTATEQ